MTQRYNQLEPRHAHLACLPAYREPRVVQFRFHAVLQRTNYKSRRSAEWRSGTGRFQISNAQPRSLTSDVGIPCNTSILVIITRIIREAGQSLVIIRGCPSALFWTIKSTYFPPHHMTFVYSPPARQVQPDWKLLAARAGLAWACACSLGLAALSHSMHKRCPLANAASRYHIRNST